MLNIVCVKQGDAFGSDYVNILADMVKRNLADGTEGRFICFTDNAQGLDSGIEAWGLPPYVKGWWSKLYLFRGDLFQKGDRVLYLDLDTLITGSLDELVAYDGPFAGLRDFYRPDNLGSGVMAWPAGWGAEIWERWRSEGKPEIEGGDQAWIEGFTGRDFVRLQDRFPGQFASFKADCRTTPPKRGTRVVCFHGRPRPHECSATWARNVWKIGGWTASEVVTYCNATDETLARNFAHAVSLPIFRLKHHDAHQGTALIVGGGPSLKRSMPWILQRVKSGAKVFALNNAADFLAQNGVTPDYQVVMDARPETAAFVGKAHRYLLASQCDPLAFASVPHEKIILWHAETPELRERYPDGVLIGGGTTVLTRAMLCVHGLGFRNLHLYGVDSSFEDQAHHAYTQSLNDDDRPSEVICEDRSFMAAQWMIAQVYEFQDVSLALAEMDSVISVHGDGLLPAVAQAMARASTLAA